MKFKYEYYQDYLEWEYIDSEFEITNITFENNHYQVNEDAIIKISRNDQYKLVGEMSEITFPNQLERNHGDLGSFIENENIIGKSRDGRITYKLTGVVMGRPRTSHSYKNNIKIIRANVIFNDIEKTWNYEDEVFVLNEWFLSAKPNFIFPRTTKRKLQKRYKRERDAIDSEKKVNKAESFGTASDYLIVKSPELSFIVARVPDKYGPEWAFNIVIEYRREFGTIPDKETRKAIAELVGFMFGNQLIKIGESSFNEQSNFMQQFFQNPSVNNVITICKSISFSPVNIDYSHDDYKIEKILTELLQPYLNQRFELQLSDTLSKFWLAKFSALGANLPILSSAVESLSEQLLKSHPKIKPFYIEYNEFSKLINAELISISEKLIDNPHKDIILKKIKDSSQRSLKNKLERMFEILELEVGKLEWKAIHARNKMAHNSFDNSNDKEVKEVIRLTKAYETLFNRIFLKILNYDGNYIDYYTLGFPERDIKEYIPES